MRNMTPMMHAMYTTEPNLAYCTKCSISCYKERRIRISVAFYALWWCLCMICVGAATGVEVLHTALNIV